MGGSVGDTSTIVEMFGILTEQSKQVVDPQNGLRAVSQLRTAGTVHRFGPNWIRGTKSSGAALRQRRFKNECDQNVRRNKPWSSPLFGAAAATIAAAQFGVFGSANAQASKGKPAGATTIKPGTNTSFGPLKQIDAGLLNVGYAEAGPTNGRAIILLHGWPYDIGHNVPQEAPEAFAKAIIEVDGY